MNSALVVVNKGIGARKYKPDMPVVRPPNQERRRAIVTVNFKDLAVPMRLMAVTSFDDKTVSDCCPHRCLLFSNLLVLPFTIFPGAVAGR